MTVKSGAQLVPWSFSRLNDYERCPFYAYEVHVKKNKQAEDAKAPWRIKGDQAHLMGQLFVNNLVAGDKAKVPLEFKQYSKELRLLVKMAKVKPRTELQMGFTRGWQPTTFFANDVWCRVVMDLAVLHASGITIVDYKTGKVYAKTTEQLRLYAVSGLAMEPKAPVVRAEAWHLDIPPRTGLLQLEVKRKDIKPIVVDFEQRVAKMARDKKLQPIPNMGCKYCHLAKSKGGPCPINL